MSRKTPIQLAESALDKLLKQRDDAREKLRIIEEDIVRLKTKLGIVDVPFHMPKMHVKPMPIDDGPPLVVPENLNPADNFGPGRIV